MEAKALTNSETGEEAIAQIFRLIGFGPMEERAYAALLRSPEPLRASEVSERSGVSRGRIYEVLDKLRKAGFCSAEEKGVITYAAYQPEVAVPSYLEALNFQLNNLIPDVETMETTPVDFMADRLRIAHTDEAIADIQTRLYARARRSVKLFEVRTLFPNKTAREMRNESRWYQTKAEADRRCADFRILVDYDVIANDVLRDRVEAVVEAGMSIRMSADLPLHALVIDDRDVMMSIPESPKLPVNPQIYIRHPDLARTLSLAFDELWNEADEYRSAMQH